MANAGRLVTRRELLETVWSGVPVSDAVLGAAMIEVRRALGDDAKRPKYVETTRRRGFRFVAPVQIEHGAAVLPFVAHRVVPADWQGAAPPAPLTSVNLPAGWTPPTTRYVRSGEANIAYQVVGEGPIDLLFVMGWITHLDSFWTQPLFARFLLRLASFSRLILFDKRGTGLSDRVTALPSLEQRIDDARAVMDAAGSPRAVVLGVSEGGPMCSLFAATYPEKTSALVLVDTCARRLYAPDYPWAPTREARSRFYEEIRESWGGPVGIEERAPSLAGDAGFRAWWATYLREGASPGAALTLAQMDAEVDVRHVLPAIRVPTLVVHRTNDRCLRVDEGRYVAALVPGARFVELTGEDHLPFVGDQDAVIDAIRAFLADLPAEHEPDHVLATVLVVTATAPDGSSLGETAWAQHETAVRLTVETFRGHRPQPLPSGFFTAFDGPARAVRCAIALAGAAASQGLDVRAGLHTGECDLAGEVIGGVAVGIAREVSTFAQPGEVVVSQMVRDLVAGSGLRFTDRGVVELAGLPVESHLYVAALVPAPA